MLLIFSSARSGSTLVLDFLSELLRFHRVFEPLMEEPEKIKGHPDFEYIHDRFRGGPFEHKLQDYKIGDFYFGHIPESAFNSDPVKIPKEKLKNYLGDIYRQYGENTVIKFVRQQGNILFFHTQLAELNVTPGYILLKRNPYEIAYSYYRMGGFHRRSTWGVNRLYHYRKNMYRGESQEIDTMFDTAWHPLDKLIAAILADYRAFDISAGWLREKGIHVFSLDYEDFIKNTPKCCKQISTLFDIPIPDETIQKTISRFNIKPAKLASSQTDPIYSRLVFNSRKRMAPWLSQFPMDPTALKGKNPLKIKHVKLLLRNLLPFIKVS